MRKPRLLAALTLATLAIACVPSPSAELKENKDLVIRFVESLNAEDWDSLDDLLTEDFRRYSQATAGVSVNSREEFKKLQKSFLISMPDQKVIIETLIAEGDRVAAYATYSGTQTGPMGDLPPTGRSFESKFLSIFRIEGARIAELWVEWDNLAILSQLGHFSPPQTESGTE